MPSKHKKIQYPASVWDSVLAAMAISDGPRMLVGRLKDTFTFLAGVLVIASCYTGYNNFHHPCDASQAWNCALLYRQRGS